MNKSNNRTGLTIILIGLSALASQEGRGQSTGVVRGLITDPSAAVIPGVIVEAAGNGTTRGAKSDGQGKYTLTLPPGKYALRARARGFVTFSQPDISVVAGQVSALDIALQIESQAQEVQVSDSAGDQVSTDPSANAGALVLKDEDLDAL